MKSFAFILAATAALLGLSFFYFSPPAKSDFQFSVKEQYLKSEYQIPMRDGKKLYTVVYAPKDTSQKYPILLNRTPYSAGPYGEAYRRSLGPSPLFMRDGYIFAYQDVRGTFMSEGEFEDVRPYLPNKRSKNEIDEASDAYDTIDWLTKNIPYNNGRVGIWGISYPGFYAAMSLMDTHPALKAASPQAPIADWFIGDDDHHNGAFFIFDSFTFNMFFGMPRLQPTPNQFKHFELPTADASQFFLELGPIPNAQARYFKGHNKYWNDVTTHGTYDRFWQARNVLPHLNKVTPAVMIVGGWFDAEDLYGTLNIYREIEKKNPKIFNVLVMGPWSHGGWASGSGGALGDIRFDSRTAEWYREKVEFPFFSYYLKDKGDLKLPEATVFRTGANEWKSFDEWPPKGAEARDLYLRENGGLSFEGPKEEPKEEKETSYDEYLSDPGNPVPFTEEKGTDRGIGYMIEDQRFVSSRPDVLVYKTDPLSEDLTLAGPITADLFVSTSGTDSDFIVKVIDVFPENAPNNSPAGQSVKMGGFQMLVRAEVMRGKFRNSYSKPEPFIPNKPAELKFKLQDVQHTFKAGHRIM
ncbi:MAG: CocE/NonD family hydrolase, partial [Blastocatellia bacterium]|nr:CocE/NonD family hydrolase [Blastocatellia bacterium]